MKALRDMQGCSGIASSCTKLLSNEEPRHRKLIALLCGGIEVARDMKGWFRNALEVHSRLAKEQACMIMLAFTCKIKVYEICRRDTGTIMMIVEAHDISCNLFSGIPICS